MRRAALGALAGLLSLGWLAGCATRLADGVYVGRDRTACTHMAAGDVSDAVVLELRRDGSCLVQLAPVAGPLRP